jgi:hypothetical protein
MATKLSPIGIENGILKKNSSVTRGVYGLEITYILKKYLHTWI